MISPSKRDTLKALNELKELFSTKEKWTQGWGAKAGTIPVPTHSEAATCWCIIGGIQKVCGLKSGSTVHNHPLAHKLYNLISAVGNIPYGALSVWNDMTSRKFSDIQKVIDKAIHFVEHGEVEI